MLLGMGCLALPWLLNAAPGPATAVIPWLGGAASLLVAWLLAGAPLPSRAVTAFTAVALALALIGRAALPLDRVALAAGVVLVVLAFALGGHWRRHPVAIAGPWLLAATVSAVIALVQYFDFAAAWQPWMHLASAGQALGNLRQPNQLASLLAIGFAAALWSASQGVRMRWLLPVVLLLALAAAATASRTGVLHWLMLSALAVLWPARTRRRSVLLCAASLATYALAVFLLPALLERATGVAPASLVARVATDLGCSSRGVLWANVLELIAQRPLLGWGWGELDYAHYMHLYRGPRFCDILDNAHNLPLHIAVELGIPAALLFCGAAAIAAWRARPWAEQDPQRRLGWSVLAVLAVHSMLEYPLWYAPFQIALGLALALLASPAREQPARLPGMRSCGVFVFCGLLLAYAAWDYARVSQVYLEPPDRHAVWAADAPAHARRSWLFSGPAGFAELTLMTVTSENAGNISILAERMLHYSPEPRVIERLIEAETMLGRTDEAVLHLARYRAAFPADYEKWRRALKLPITPP